jgi:predicted Zn-ribbon and HTH transcriptional regulator
MNVSYKQSQANKPAAMKKLVAKAQKHHLLVVQGKPCRKCGSTERYKQGGRCVPCKQSYNSHVTHLNKRERMHAPPSMMVAIDHMLEGREDVDPLFN